MDQPTTQPPPTTDPLEGAGVPVQQPPIDNAKIYELLAESVDLGRRGIRLTEEEVMPRVRRLEVRIFGSNPPPLLVYPPTAEGELAISPKPSSPPLVDRTTATENGLEGLTQELSNFKSEIRDELGQQSRSMGLVPVTAPRRKTVRQAVFSRSGLKDALALVTLIAALWAAITGRSPPPAAALPQSTVSR